MKRPSCRFSKLGVLLHITQDCLPLSSENEAMVMDAKTFMCSALKEADVIVGGSRPWDVRVHNETLYDRVVRQGTLGLGEAYMDGWWDCDALDVMISKALRANLEDRVRHKIPDLIIIFLSTLLNLQSVRRASMVAECHYNFSNEMFEQMIGPTMNYSCGYWKDAPDLDHAQKAKMDMICKKLELQKGMNVLDIGCGWGGLCRYMAENYGVKVTGITVSSEQVAYAKAKGGDLPITWLLQDYRSLTGRFDRIVSVGMFEHVGAKNYDIFLETTKKLLDPDGLFLLHTIGKDGHMCGVDPWINKYIFPNGSIPSAERLTKALATKYVIEDWHNFGADYDKTLMAWHKNFEEGVSKGVFSCTDRVHRMFRYYLLTCAGAFRARDIQLWQVVLSPRGVLGGYHCR